MTDKVQAEKDLEFCSAELSKYQNLSRSGLTRSDVANTIMKKKQNDLPLIKALEANDSAFKQNPDKNMHKIISMIIRDAYEQPSYSTPSIKEEQLNEFSAKYYLGCISMYD